MKYGQLNLGQIEALVNKVGGIIGVQAILSGELVVGKPAEMAQVKHVATKILKRIGKKTIACGAFNLPATFWKTGSTLWVDPALAPILHAATPLPAGNVAFNRHLIMKEGGALDSEIRVNGVGLPFTPSQFLQSAQTLIETQSGGIAGDLLSDGKANIFYVGCGGVVFTVYVRWHQVSGRWDVDVWRFGDSRWGAGRQVFSPAT